MRFLLIFAFFVPNLVNAQTGNLSILADKGEPFTVFLNDIKQNDKPVSVLRIEDLTAPFYKLRIEFSDTSLKSINRNSITIVDVNETLMDVVYKLKADKPGKMKLELYSMTPVGQPEILKDTVIIKSVSQKSIENSIGIVLKPTVAIDPDVDVAKSEKKVKSKTAPVKKCNGWPIAKEDFETLKSVVTEAKTESAKLKSAKNIASSNCLLVSQILQICLLFPSEPAKLEFAEFVYQYTLDRQNFSKLKELFKNPAQRAKIGNIIDQQ